MNKVILRESVTGDDVDDAMEELGCRLINVIPSAQSHPGQSIYATRDRQRFLYLVEDGMLGLSYFTGSGEEIGAELDEIGKLLDCDGEGVLDELLLHGHEDASLARALSILVLTVEAPNGEHLSFFKESLEHSSNVVRNAALVALTYVLWPSLRGQVERLAKSDDDDMVRLNAQRVLELYGQ